MSSRRPRRKPGENRELLIEAGLVEFGLLGYSGTSTAAIAARADVPQPHVYANFSTKQELFLACFERVANLVQTAPTASHARFLYQAVAAVGDEQLSAELLSGITALKEGVGEQAFFELLNAGAAAHLLLPHSPLP